MVASVPDTDPRIPARNRTHLAYQLVDEPESAVTIASSGSCSESSHATRMGLTGSAASRLCRRTVSHHRLTPLSMVSRHDGSALGRRYGISAPRAAFASATMLISVG